jgi:hypothetical protein
MDISELIKRFTYHEPTPEKIDTFRDIRQAGFNLVEILNKVLPDSREKSLAITNIEQAVMWANASLARNKITKDK